MAERDKDWDAKEANRIREALTAPFDADQVKFKPGYVSGTRAMAVAYVDARAVMDRLDDVLGITGWQDDYEVLDNAAIKCRLCVLIGNDWITKCDVGGQSEQPDEGDRSKAAFSDALKRAAVKFGIGRYLYKLKNQWCDYDTQNRRFASAPILPPEFRPSNKLTTHQIDELDELLSETQSDRAAFAKHFMASNWDTIAASVYMDAHRALSRKRRKMMNEARTRLQTAMDSIVESIAEPTAEDAEKATGKTTGESTGKAIADAEDDELATKESVVALDAQIKRVHGAKAGEWYKLITEKLQIGDFRTKGHIKRVLAELEQHSATPTK